MRTSLLLLVIGLLFLGCTTTAGTNATLNTSPPTPVPVKVAAKGDTVSVFYAGSYDNGTIFDTNLADVAIQAGLAPRPQYLPLTFRIGAGQMIPGFEAAVIGMKEGESKSVRLEPKDAYGEYLEEMVLPFNISLFHLREGKNLTAGGKVQTSNGMVGRIESFNSTTVIVDFNDPMAGKTLLFNITVKSIAKAPSSGLGQ